MRHIIHEIIVTEGIIAIIEIVGMMEMSKFI